MGGKDVKLFEGRYPLGGFAISRSFLICQTRIEKQERLD